MIYRNALFFTCWTIAYGQPLPAPPGVDVGKLTDQARRFIDLYGVAAQLMNFGGSIINNARNVYDSAGSSGNSISSDLIRPWFRLAGTKSSDGLVNRSYGSDYDYGIRPTQSNGIEMLLNTFLGSTFFGQTTLPPPTNLANFFKPNYHESENYHSTGGSNIDRLINLLRRSGAQRATPNLDSSANLLQSIFGKR